MFTHAAAEHYTITYLRLAQRIFTQAEETPATIDFTVLSKYASLRPFGDFNQNLGEALAINVEAILSEEYKQTYALLRKEINRSKIKIRAYLKKLHFPITKKSTLEKCRLILLAEIPDFFTLLRDYFPAGTNEQELNIICTNLSRAYLYSFLKPGDQKLDLFLNFFCEALFREKRVGKAFEKIMEASIVKSIANADNLYHHIEIIGIKKVTRLYIKNLKLHLSEFSGPTLQMFVRSLAIMREKISNGRDVTEFKLISEILKVFAKKALKDAEFKAELDKYIAAYSSPGSYTMPETSSELKYNAVNTIKKEYLTQLKLAKNSRKEKMAKDNQTHFKIPFIPPLTLSLLGSKSQTKNSSRPASNDRNNAPKSNERQSAPSPNHKLNPRAALKKSKTEDSFIRPSKSPTTVSLSPHNGKKSSTSHLLYSFEQDRSRLTVNSSTPIVHITAPTVSNESSAGGNKSQPIKSGSLVMVPQTLIHSEVPEENPIFQNNNIRSI